MTQGRRARQRRAPATTRRTTTRRSPRRISRRSSASTPTCSSTCRTRKPTSRPRRARFSASTTRTARTRSQKLFEVQRDRFYQAHTYKHTTMGFIKDIENMPNEYAYSKMFFERWYRPAVHDGHRRRRRDAGAGAAARREVLGRLEGRDRGAGGDSARSRRRTARMYVHVPWTSDTLPWVTVAFPGPAFDENEQGLRGDGHARRALLRPDVRPLQEARRDRAEGRSAPGRRAGERRSVAVHGPRAREERADDAVYVRDQILATVAAAPARRWCRPSGWRTRSRTTATRSRARSTAPSASPRSLSRYASYKRSYQTVNNYYRTLESLDAGRPAGRGAQVLHRRGLIVTTLSKDPLPAGIEKAPALRRAPAAPAAAGEQPRRRPPRRGAGPPRDSASTAIVLQKSPSAAAQRQAAVHRRLGARSGGQGRPGGADRGDDRRDAGSKALTIDEIDARALSDRRRRSRPRPTRR